MIRDLCHSFRRLCGSPAFTSVIILTLALGIGVNTAIFSIVNATFLRPLPYADPNRIMMVTENNGGGEIGVAYPDFLDWQAQQSVFSALALYYPQSAKLKTTERIELVSTCLVSGDFFSVLGINPSEGRGLNPSDDRIGAAPVTWVTHEASLKYFPGDRELVGRHIVIDNQSVTIAGVLPKGYRFHQSIEFYRPIAPYAERLFLMMRGEHDNVHVLGRLKAGITQTAAQAQMSTIARGIENQYPRDNTGIGARVVQLRERLAGTARTQLLLLMGAVAMVLLIACLNVANMLLSRSIVREREMAIRTALGASRTQLVRQVLSECLLLAAAGGVCGVLLGMWGYDFARRLIPWEMQSLADAAGGIDARVMLFVTSATLLSGFGFGLAPSWYLSRANPIDALKNVHRTMRTIFGKVRLSDILAVAQVALALVLLVGAGLLARSLQQLLRVPSGIRPERVLTLQVAPPPMSLYQSDPYSFAAFHNRIIDAVAALPEIETAAADTNLPFTWNTSVMGFYREGRPTPAPGEFPYASRHSVSPNYFRAMGIPILRGRTFDGQELQPVIPPGLDLSPKNFGTIFKNIVFDGIISQRMADAYWPGEDPIGKRFRLGYTDMQLPWVKIVGVVGNTTQTGQDRGETAEFYLPLRQFPMPVAYLVVRTRMEPAQAIASIRVAIQSVVKDEPIHDIQLMSERMAGFVSDRRFNMNLFATFAGVALLLALVGIYGVLSFVVAQSTREVGIRLALGAQRGDVMRGVILRGLRLAVPGIFLGIAGAWGVSRLLQSQLFGITGTDPMAYVLGAALLLTAALAACFIPARRAAMANPIDSLRAE